MRLLKLGVAALALALGTKLSAQQVVTHEAVTEPGPVDPYSQTDEVAIERDRHERMTVPVLVSGAGPYQFLVDTGADRTAVSREIADSLNLKGGRSARLHSVTGAEVVGTVRVPLLQLSRKRVERIEAPTLERRHMGADGILGVDALRSQRVMFDFKNNELSIVPSREVSLPMERDAIVVRANARKGHLILTKAEANDRTINVIIDTGSQISIANEALRKWLGIRRPKDSDVVSLLSVTGSTLLAHYAIIDSLDLGGAVLKRLPVVFADAHTFRRLEMENRPTLLLGMNAMRAFDRVSIDFAQKKIRVVLPQNSALDGAQLAGQ